MTVHRAPVRVIGIGTEFRRDDVAGLAVADLVAAAVLPFVEVSTGDGEPTRLIDAWAGARLAIVVDAVHGTGEPPGTVHRIPVDDAADLRLGPGTSHGLGIGDAVALGRALGLMPDRLILYAVEISDASLGLGVTPAVRVSIPDVAATVQAEAARALEGA